MEKPVELTINRSNWLRGEGGLKSRLLRERDGKMCCLGFLALQQGYTPEEITNLRTPAELANKTQGKPMPEVLQALTMPAPTFEDHKPKNVYASSSQACDLMFINDDVSDEGREGRLRREFAKIGVNVTFVD